jgi:additional sex combs-like protein
MIITLLFHPTQTDTFTQISTNQVVSASPTVVTINSAPTKSIFVRQTRPPQIFQSQQHQQIFTTTQQQPTQQTIMQAQNQLMQPRMRHIHPHRPPPGSVNLERSYQICQAVIQNSPNRHQLNCQLKPPPTSLLGGSGGACPMGQKKM